MATHTTAHTLETRCRAYTTEPVTDKARSAANNTHTRAAAALRDHRVRTETEADTLRGQGYTEGSIYQLIGCNLQGLL